MCPPVYPWRDSKNPKTVVEVLRPFAEYRVPPTEEEHPGASEIKWERIIGPATINRGEGWGSKGNWGNE